MSNRKSKRQLRAEAVERLKNITLDPEGGSHEHLSAICGAIYAPSYGWTHGACDGLARTLIGLLTDEPNDELAPESGVSADAAESNDAISEYLGQSRDSGIDARECQPIRDLMDECAELERTVDRLTEENDALREWKACYERACAERDECADLADKLERRVRELEGMLPPLIAADGQPIEVGQVLYGESDGKAWTVDRIDYGRHHPVMAHSGKKTRALKPRWLTHERPDSLERALADLRRMADFLPDGNWQATAHGIAERIEKLAKEGA